ncbi:MAG: SURF1 family protein [Gammaproteobacteria bacterium]|nr:SURF1 family protein [Gammaproteobacteria bacterium]
MEKRRRLAAATGWWLALAGGSAAFAALGMWQIRRGDTERLAIAQLQAERRAAPAPLARGAGLPPQLFVRATAHGIYDSARQVLVDGQAHDDVPGYDVLTPLRLDDGSLLLVNRGFVPAAAGPRSRAVAPAAPAGPRSVVGLWRALPQPALRLGGADACTRDEPVGKTLEGHAPARRIDARRTEPAAGRWPRLFSYPSPAQLRCLYGSDLLSGELLLDADQPGGFVRDWQISPGFPPARHYGYAAQWFLFLLAWIALLVKLNLKRVPR